jgi:hypothetical protein
MFTSARQNTYSLLEFDDYRNDYRIDDIFVLPCFGAGPIRSNFYHLIANRLQIEWAASYKGIYIRENDCFKTI